MADLTSILQEYVVTANNPEYEGNWILIQAY